MLAVIGLGNPGDEYAKTRHNMGFMAVDAVHVKYDFPEWRKKPKYLFSKGKINGLDVVLIKPSTFMNMSGEAALAVSAAYKIPPENMIVIHDDLDLPAGKIRIKKGGGTAGHNGLKSIDAAMGREYRRIRIGISHPKDGARPRMEVADYVLARPAKDECAALEKSVSEVAGIALPAMLEKLAGTEPR